MKRIASLLIGVLLLIVGQGQVHADTVDNVKKDLPVVIINNSFPDPNRFQVKIKLDLPVIFMEQLEASLSSKYNIISLNPDPSILDLSSTERADILQIFKETDYTSVILAEILPLQIDSQPKFPAPDTVTIVHFKVVDLRNDKYLYNGKLQAIESSSRKAIKKISTQFVNVLEDIL